MILDVKIEESDTTFDCDCGESNTTLDCDFGEVVSVVYSESIIAMSIEGHELTYIKADGSTHTITIPDDDTQYFLATDETTGLTKLYATMGNAEDGTMTQKAITTELKKKVSVSVDEKQKSLIFST